jgi:hypothetical protein
MTARRREKGQRSAPPFQPQPEPDRVDRDLVHQSDEEPNAGKEKQFSSGKVHKLQDRSNFPHRLRCPPADRSASGSHKRLCLGWQFRGKKNAPKWIEL